MAPESDLFSVKRRQGNEIVNGHGPVRIFTVRVIVIIGFTTLVPHTRYNKNSRPFSTSNIFVEK